MKNRKSKFENRNFNDPTAKFYNSLTSILKPEELTQEEIQLIQSYSKPGDSILDIGAGTGRHAIKLGELGYKVTALEDSFEMVNVMKSKIQNNQYLINKKDLKIINSDIFTFNLEPLTFNLVLLFWNTFNEICLTEKQALDLLRKCKELLKENGKIIINIDDSTTVDPEHFNFEYKFFQDNKEYMYSWKTVDYDPKTNTSTSEEIISNDIEEYKTQITQRYWSISEFENLVHSLGLSMKVKKLKTSEELYLIVS